MDGGMSEGLKSENRETADVTGDLRYEAERWKVKWGIAQIDKKHKGNKNIQRWQNIYTYIFEIRDFFFFPKEKQGVVSESFLGWGRNKKKKKKKG